MDFSRKLPIGVQDFQNVLYIVFTMLGRFVKKEVQSARGREDKS